MEAKKNLRKVARQGQTRAANCLNDGFANSASSAEIKRLVEILKTRAARLRTLDEEILAETPADELEEEFASVCSYEDAATSAISAAEERLQGSIAASSISSASSSASHAPAALPRLRLPSFAGDSLDSDIVGDRRTPFLSDVLPLP